ncbi:hypothetical protein [Streptomyces sp. NPDC101206]|uniref:hypothetical protein n=1 Tax=Streptomyces sp. NPDC101206 TaxID=3366128 RepID=UPI003829DA0C
MPEYEIHALTDFHYELIDALPDGLVCQVKETPGTAVTYILKGHATPEFAAFMSEVVRPVLEPGGWHQYWEPGAPRLELPPQGLGYATAKWEVITEEDADAILAPGELARGVERAGAFVYLIRPGHASPELVDAFNAILDRLIGDGLIRQDWQPTDS